MLVLIIAKYRLLQNYSYDTLYNRVILAMFFYFAVLNTHVASKILEQTTYIHKQVIQKKILQMRKLRPTAT